FTPLPPAPHRAHRVNHILGGQPMALRDPRLPGGAAADPPALLQELRPGGVVDGAVHAAAAQDCRVRCVDYRVHGLLGDVPPSWPSPWPPIASCGKFATRRSSIIRTSPG